MSKQTEYDQIRGIVKMLEHREHEHDVAIRLKDQKIHSLQHALRRTYGAPKGGEVLIDGTDYVPWADLPKYAENHVKALREAQRREKELHLTLPRVITADELREGQLVAVFNGHARMVGHVTEATDAEVTVRDVCLHTWEYNGVSPLHTIVLLADAPAEPKFAPGGKVEYRAPEPERRGEVISQVKLKVGDIVDVYRHGQSESIGATATYVGKYLTRIRGGGAIDSLGPDVDNPNREIRLVFRPSPPVPDYVCPDCGETVPKVTHG